MMFRYSSVILIVLAVTCRTEPGNRHLRSVLSALFQVPAETEQQDTCAGCRSKYTVTEEELTALRIEYIKNQILKKLRLKEKPTVSFADLPKPFTGDEPIISVEPNDIEPQYGDDYYGKTTQVIVFPLEDDGNFFPEEIHCGRKVRYASACLQFKMPKDVHYSDVSMAELWIHKERDSLDSHNQTFVISEFAHWDPKQSFQKTKPIAIHGTSLSEGWVKIDVAWAVKNWLEFHSNEPIHALNIACKTCAMSHDSSPISTKGNLKPFLIIYTFSEQRRTSLRRQRRQVNCSPGGNECCRESLYVSFADIGWDDWILQPAGYNAYFCRGSCTAAAAVTLSATQHNSILQKVMLRSAPNKNSGARLDLTPCCAGTHFLPLDLVYMYSNKTILKKLLPNMIVDQCGCM